MIRQFQYGIRKLREHFPDISFSTYAVEEPCFTSALPAVLKGFGFRYAVLKNPNTCWGGYMAPMEGELIRWTGPDGSSVITSPRHRFEGLSDDVWSTLANGADAGYYDQALQAGFKHPVGMCYQDAGWTRGPWLEWFPKHGKKLENILWTDYFERIATDVIPVDYRVKQDDIRVALVWGSQVLQRIARGVRQGENQLVQAEKMGSLAFLANGFRIKPPALTCGTTHFAARRERAVCFEAYENALGEQALAIANATSEPQRLTGSWNGRTVDIVLAPPDL